MVFTLLFGQELKDALNDERSSSNEPQHEGISTPREESDDDSLNPDGSLQSSIPSDPEQAEGILSSLGKWLPKILRSGGTPGGSSTPSDRRSSSYTGDIDSMEDHKVEDVLRELHGSTNPT